VSIQDEMNAQRALMHYLTEWGVEDAGRKAQKFIDELTGRGWQMALMWESRPQPPRAADACLECGRHTDRCICPQVVTRPDERVPPNDAYRAKRDALRQAIADQAQEDVA
jgi:hypothetical protein